MGMQTPIRALRLSSPQRSLRAARIAAAPSPGAPAPELRRHDRDERAPDERCPRVHERRVGRRCRRHHHQPQRAHARRYERAQERGHRERQVRERPDLQRHDQGFPPERHCHPQRPPQLDRQGEGHRNRRRRQGERRRRWDPARPLTHGDRQRQRRHEQGPRLAVGRHRRLLLERRRDPAKPPVRERLERACRDRVAGEPRGREPAEREREQRHGGERRQRLHLRVRQPCRPKQDWGIVVGALASARVVAM